MQITTTRPHVSAVLGPTNTGKTHLAMERMLGHESGIIGFPLRLLARENYERAVAVKGARQVALITGEEKIVPPRARYFICTVESMPVGRAVSFLAVDEIQMCADGERGHIFTDRLLHARGADETMFLGAETVRRRIRQLVPEARFDSRPRFSTLRYAGRRKITRLPPRSVIVAFSAAEVYAIAELVRRQRGGAAVVLGALSPRTRNAQVAMFQAGEVDHLVATDAIGMGLNMDVDHVAFAETRKFDGHVPRDLTAGELAQIAGRAGRHMNDGTFGTTADIGGLDADIVARIENHQFEALRTLYWRNGDLRFTSLGALRSSLAQAPTHPNLVRVRRADDERALEGLTKEPDIAALAAHPDRIRLLWEVCRIPDFRKVMSDAHGRLLGRIYRYLTGPGERLPTDWVAAQVARLEPTDGDIETIVQRIASVRTWTTVSFHGDWLDDAGHWQERTREVEDALSDALHERLTQRFVDRRTAVLAGRLKDAGTLLATVREGGEVVVEGHAVGHLEGFRFTADSAERDTTAGRAVANAAARALGGEIADRVRRLESAPDGAFAFAAADGRVLWNGEAVARLAAGADILHPIAEPLASDLLSAAARQRLHRRLSAWLEGAVERGLAPLFRAREAPLKGAARGLVFQLGEGLGSLPRRSAGKQAAALGREERKQLRALGIRLGRESIFMPDLIKPGAVALRALLWAAHSGRQVAPPAPGRVSLALEDGVPADFYEAIGYRPLGRRAVRVDMVERLAAGAWSMSRRGPFAATPELHSLAGCDAGDLGRILAALGYRRNGNRTNGTGVDGTGAVTFSRAPRPRDKRRPRGKSPSPRADSPFAKLGRIDPPR